MFEVVGLVGPGDLDFWPFNNESALPFNKTVITNELSVQWTGNRQTASETGLNTYSHNKKGAVFLLRSAGILHNTQMYGDEHCVAMKQQTRRRATLCKTNTMQMINYCGSRCVTIDRETRPTSEKVTPVQRVLLQYNDTDSIIVVQSRRAHILYTVSQKTPPFYKFWITRPRQKWTDFDILVHRIPRKFTFRKL